MGMTLGDVQRPLQSLAEGDFEHEAMNRMEDKKRVNWFEQSLQKFRFMAFIPFTPSF
jgi:hypothetical protein